VPVQIVVSIKAADLNALRSIARGERSPAGTPAEEVQNAASAFVERVSQLKSASRAARKRRNKRNAKRQQAGQAVGELSAQLNTQLEVSGAADASSVSSR
jgi:hypothetical protein